LLALALLHAGGTFDGMQTMIFTDGYSSYYAPCVNSQICFAADEDIAAYVNWLKEFARRYGVLIHGSEIPMSTARYSCNANNKDQPSERSPRKTNSPQVIGKKRFLIGQSLISQIPAHDSLSMKNSG
jgi:hypothetical protein